MVFHQKCFTLFPKNFLVKLYKISIVFLSLCFLTQAGFTQYQKLHKKAIVVDTHNDILTTCLDDGLSFDQNLRGKTHSDLNRFKEGGVDVQVFSIWCDGRQQNPFAYANKQIDTLYATAQRNPDKMKIVYSSKDLLKTVRKQKLAAMIGVEGGHMIENDLAKLDSLYKRGARYMTLTWNNSNPWATSAMEETRDSLLKQPKGLSDFGKKIVKRMNDLGMLADLSHVGEKTFWDAIHTTTKPVLVSHSCVYTLCPAFRNLKDDQIRAIGKNGGVIHLNFFSGFLDSTYDRKEREFLGRHKDERDSLIKNNYKPSAATEFLSKKYKDESEALRAPFHLLFDHLDYIVKLIGVDHVGLGSDFDGINSTPQQLDGVRDYPLITKELLARGYSKKDIRKILGSNFISLLKANEK